MCCSTRSPSTINKLNFNNRTVTVDQIAFNLLLTFLKGSHFFKWAAKHYSNSIKQRINWGRWEVSWNKFISFLSETTTTLLHWHGCLHIFKYNWIKLFLIEMIYWVFYFPYVLLNTKLFVQDLEDERPQLCVCCIVEQTCSSCGRRPCWLPWLKTPNTNKLCEAHTICFTKASNRLVICSDLLN